MKKLPYFLHLRSDIHLIHVKMFWNLKFFIIQDELLPVLFFAGSEFEFCLWDRSGNSGTQLISIDLGTSWGKTKKSSTYQSYNFRLWCQGLLIFRKILSFLNSCFQAGTDISTEVAKKALKRMKTLRHPSVVTYIDSVESEKFIYIATEVVTPLSAFLDNIADRHGL